MKQCFLFLSLTLLIGCKDFEIPTASQDLQTIIDSYQNHESYDSEIYPLGLVTKEYYESEALFAKEKLQELSLVTVENLSETERISAALLKFVLEDQVAFYEFERYLNPLLSDAGFHLSLGYMVRPLVNYKQGVDYLRKLEALPLYVDQHFKNLQAGLDQGVSQPKVIFKGYESTYDSHILADYEESFFYQPLAQLPDNITGPQKDSLRLRGKKAIEEMVVPQFRRIKDFFENTYIPAARNTIGVLDTPNGAAYYQDRINYYTTSTQYTAKDIHEIGLAEVARIRTEMKEIIASLNFDGSFADFFHFLRTDEQFYAKTPKELLMIARDMAKRADEQLPRFFKTLPRKPYGVAAVPDAIAPKYTGGRYVGTAANSSDPGYYWVNTYNLPSRTLYTLPALTVHEAVPGHHLQGALNNELGDSIPRFRRNLYLSAYGEGWGLYAEFLANEMDMYTTPYEHFGKLTYEMWRACRLVVDTGIHAMGWTREEVVQYMSENTALSLHEIQTETDRYISWPGQALSYKIGEIKIRVLREKAQEALGTSFDIRDFHEVVLGQGTVSLSILEDRVMTYIQKAKALQTGSITMKLSSEL
jgi:uncharacterized protein (DUF885 family)